MPRTGNPAFQKGKPPPKGAGRKKGTPNKRTIEIADALNAAFEGSGGVTALTEYATANRDEFYKLWVKLLPKEIRADLTTLGEKISNPIELTDALNLIKEMQGAKS